MAVDVKQTPRVARDNEVPEEPLRGPWSFSARMMFLSFMMSIYCFESKGSL